MIVISNNVIKNGNEMVLRQIITVFGPEWKEKQTYSFIPQPEIRYANKSGIWSKRGQRSSGKF